jgi:hypothetical protein
VTDEGECNPDALAQSLTLASFTAGDLYVQAQTETGEHKTLVWAPPSA